MKISCKSELNSQITNILKYIEVRNSCWDFRNYNYFIILNFLLMSNISITIDMYVESQIGVVKLDVQCDYRLLLPLFLMASAISRLNYWWFFCQSIPYIWHCCLHIPVISRRVSFSWCPKLRNQVDWGHRN